MAGVENEPVWLSGMSLPQRVKGLMALDSKGISPESATTQLTKTEEDGTTLTIPVRRIPLIDIGYPTQDAADDAILRAMGYEPGDNNGKDI